MGVNLGPANPEPGGSGGNILEQIFEGIGGIGAALAEGLNGIIGMIADALFGPGGGSPIVRLSDGMTELNNRVDLMADVSGYGGMILSNKHKVYGGNDYKVVPFNTPYGPSTKSVTLDTANHRIYLARGTWSVSMLLAVPQAGITGGPTWFRATITAYRPNGTEYLNQWLDWRSGENPHGYYAQVPLVVPDDSGYYVQIRFTHNTGNWHILGGTDRSKFWVNRWDLRTDDNNMIINPPDGPDVT